MSRINQSINCIVRFYFYFFFFLLRSELHFYQVIKITRIFVLGTGVSKCISRIENKPVLTRNKLKEISSRSYELNLKMFF